jgi:hypothetical protein
MHVLSKEDFLRHQQPKKNELLEILDKISNRISNMTPNEFDQKFADTNFYVILDIFYISLKEDANEKQS